MILDNEITVGAAPETVFALINDAERVAACLPGAALEGRDGDTYSGRVKVKVGPITAAYSGTVRFLDVDHDQRRLRLQARGVDVHGSGDAEAEVTLVVGETAGGALLRVKTDLVIGGKIVQFGKGAIGAVADRILQQFARNLAGLLDTDTGAGGAKSVAAAPRAVVPAGDAEAAELNGLSLLLGPAAKYLPLAVAFGIGLWQGWLLGKLRAQRRLLEELRRG